MHTSCEKKAWKHPTPYQAWNSPQYMYITEDKHVTRKHILEHYESMRAWEHKWEQIFLLYAYKLFIISLLYRQWGHEGIIASNFAMMMRQEDFRKLFEEENDPLRANALSYDFAGEPMFTQYSF